MTSFTSCLLIRVEVQGGQTLPVLPSMPGTSSAHRNNLLNLIGLCQRDEQRTSQKLCSLALALWQYLVVSRLTRQVWSLLNGTHNSHLGLPLVFPLLPVVGSDTKESSSEREGMCALWEIHAWLQRGDKVFIRGCQKGGSSQSGRYPGAVCLVRLSDPMDCVLPGSSSMGILQAGILESVAMLSSRGLPNPAIEPKDESHVLLFVTPWTIQSMEFSRPEYWSG